MHVEIQDSVAAVNAAKVLIEQAEGRPGIATGDDVEMLVIQRVEYDTVDAPHCLALLDAGNLEQLRAELQSSLPLDEPTLRP